MYFVGSILLITATIIAVILYRMELLHFTYDAGCSNRTVAGFAEIWLILYRSLVGTPSPLNKCLYSTRSLLGLWFLCCFCINSFYNTTLISFLTDPGFNKQINSLEEVIDSKLDIMFPDE